MCFDGWILRDNNLIECHESKYTNMGTMGIKIEEDVHSPPFVWTP